MPSVSLYPNIRDPRVSSDVDLDFALDGIQNGMWQDDVFAVRTSKREKNTVPAFTVSGRFSERKVSGLIEHSGYISIDVDNVEDLARTKSILQADKYVYAVFTSVSGHGLCAIFKINGAKHTDSFNAIGEYLFSNYGIVIDQSGKDVSRLRFVSFDPELWINRAALKFNAPAAKKQAKIPETVFVQSDFDGVIQEIVSQGLDLTATYERWLRICFAIADKFGEGGRDYFHQVSQFSNLYDQKKCDRQYESCLKAGRTGITIATLYHYAKEAGISVMSEKTRTIVKAAVNSKKATINPSDVIKGLQEFEGLSPELTADIVNQVYAGNIVSESESDIEAAKIFVRSLGFRHNIITNQIESDGLPLTERQYSDTRLKIKSKFSKLDFTTINNILESSVILSYHPVQEFFFTNLERTPAGTIKEFCECIESTTGFSGKNFRPDYVEYFITKWLVGMVACAFGEISPLILVMTGAQNSGKTELFRRLLPSALKPYFAIKTIASVKSETQRRDFEIAMSKYWLIVFDEMGSGTTASELNAIKSIVSADKFNARAAYGRHDKEFKRLAALGATTNYKEILNDTTGNRRFIPIEVISIDKARKDKIDPIDIFMEAYQLYKSGYEYRLSPKDIQELGELTQDFQEPSTEDEMVRSCFAAKPDNNGVVTYREWSATEIKNYLEKFTKDRINNNRLAAALKDIGVERKMKFGKGRFYCLYLIPA